MSRRDCAESPSAFATRASSPFAPSPFATATGATSDHSVAELVLELERLSALSQCDDDDNDDDENDDHLG